MAMVGLTGRKLAWCNVGDASIQLFRPAPGEGRLRCVFSTVEQRSTVRTASGQEIQMPLQLGCYSHADQTVEHAVKSMEGANFGIMTPEVGDIILVCSDEVTDNLGGNLLVRSLEAHLGDCYDMARGVVEDAISAGRKIDDLEQRHPRLL